MSDDKPRDVLQFLAAVNRRVYTELRGEHGNRPRTALVRLTVLVVVLGLAGPILWAAILNMPPALVVIVGLFILVRVGRWYAKRNR